MITKRYQSVTHNIQYIQGKLALLHKAKERAIGLLSSAIEAFKQADLRDGEELAVDSPHCIVMMTMMVYLVLNQHLTLMMKTS